MSLRSYSLLPSFFISTYRETTTRGQSTVKKEIVERKAGPLRRTHTWIRSFVRNKRPIQRTPNHSRFPHVWVAYTSVVQSSPSTLPPHHRHTQCRTHRKPSRLITLNSSIPKTTIDLKTTFLSFPVNASHLCRGLLRNPSEALISLSALVTLSKINHFCGPNRRDLSSLRLPLPPSNKYPSQQIHQSIVNRHNFNPLFTKIQTRGLRRNQTSIVLLSLDSLSRIVY
ncbi:hypothetical protein BcDW1_6037 [Botrytis cinerea BcDW1]|uniref:Uncharacterized protein n=1 Tax=Botryotinia fuckeliana (strain BcDW1) TaxID=1290391 RepID=M7TVI9_BOTF1|nr:hypothetical protein BcDW1_6037 [Botrytis cinerea BcDW1]